MTEIRRELHAAFETVAVTGTNGKTTTTGMLESIVRAAGEPSARITTLGAWVNGELIAEGSTTEAFALGIEAAKAARVRTLALETTSRALANGFAQVWPARVAVFTNLSRDHLDYHGDAEHYLAAKAQLFMQLVRGGTAVFNAADPASALLSEVTPASARRMAFCAARANVPEECRDLPLELRARSSSVTRTETRIELDPGFLGSELVLQVIGEVNVDNALAAALGAHALGYSPENIAVGLREFSGTSGRFEPVWRNPFVVVDYAHTPDALSRTLDQARNLAAGGRVLLVFGCGGDSDPGKRPEMGRVAAERADWFVVTADNPRYESPEAIAEDILRGAKTTLISPEEDPARGGRTTQGRQVVFELDPDRARAITRAIEEARLGDIVVIAGKGHERTQTIVDRVLEFDDAEVASAACRARFGEQ